MFNKLLKWLWSPINNEHGGIWGFVLGIAGAIIGTIIAPGVGTLIGFGIGTTVGNILFPTVGEQSPFKANDVQVSSSQYGIPVPVVFGRRKIPGNLLWYGDFQVHERESDDGGGGCGGKGGGAKYNTYTVSLCYGLCHGPGRLEGIWYGNDRLDVAITDFDPSPYSDPDTLIASGTVDWAPEIWDEGFLIYVPPEIKRVFGATELCAQAPSSWLILTKIKFTAPASSPNYNITRNVIRHWTKDTIGWGFTEVCSMGYVETEPFPAAIQVGDTFEWNTATYFNFGKPWSFRSTLPGTSGAGIQNIWLRRGEDDQGVDVWDSGGDVFTGTHTQGPSYLSSFVPRVPVWKGLCYVMLYNFDLGTSPFIQNFTFEVSSCPGVSGTSFTLQPDYPPPVIAHNMLTNNFYGLGLSNDYWDFSASGTTRDYCVANDLLISPIFNAQNSVLDTLTYILLHHDGYISYEEGKIAYRQMMYEAPRGHLDEDILLRKDDFPVAVSRKGTKGYFNKIIVEYTKRYSGDGTPTYCVGTVVADDTADIDRYGLIDTTINLSAYTVFPRAGKIANLLLMRGLSNPETYSFKLGPICYNLRVGEVFLLSDGQTELDHKKIRVVNVSETPEYEVEVTAVEEIDSVYNYFIGGSDTSQQPVPPNLGGPPESALGKMSIELPAILSGSDPKVIVDYSRSTSTAWAGAELWASYSASGTYSFVEDNPGGGVTGYVFDKISSSIYLYLHPDYTLSSALSFEQLVSEPNKNVLFIRGASGDVWCKFQTVELVASHQWKLTGFIYDLYGIPVLDTSKVIVGDTFALYSAFVPYTRTISYADKHRWLFFKLPSYNYARTYQQPLDDINYSSEYIDALCDKPLAPCNITVAGSATGESFESNRVYLSGSSAKIKGAVDIELTWKTRNRFATGRTVTDRTDAIVDDSDFQSYEIKVCSDMTCEGSTLKRTEIITNVATKSWIYTASDQSSDGFSATATIIFKFKQNNSNESSDETVVTVYRVT